MRLARQETSRHPLVAPLASARVDDLADARQRIDAIDAEVLRLIEERLRVVEDVRRAKSGPPLDPAREHELLAKHQADSLIEPGDVEAIFRAVMGAALRRQGGLHVAYLGPEGTWSHRAVQQRFGSGAQGIPRPDLEAVVDAFVGGQAGHAVVPVHNSATGPILEGLRLVQHRPVSVVGRMDLHVPQALLGPDGPIHAVHSHPEALQQCREALKQLAPGARRVAAASTAQALQDAVVAGEHAIGDADQAKLHGVQVRVPVLAESRTRFLILGQEATRPTGNDRTMVVLRIKDEAGSLSRCLDVMAHHGVDLRWIQAMPCPGAPADTEFMMELNGHREDGAMDAALGDLHADALAVRVLGSYPVLDR